MRRRNALAVFLQRMAAIRIAVRHIVDEIHHARQRAEHRERAARLQDRRHIEESLTEQQPAENDQVLRPLLRPERADKAVGQWPRGGERVPASRLGLFDDVRNTVSRHSKRGGYVRGLTNCRSS